MKKRISGFLFFLVSGAIFAQSPITVTIVGNTSPIALQQLAETVEQTKNSVEQLKISNNALAIMQKQAEKLTPEKWLAFIENYRRHAAAMKAEAARIEELGSIDSMLYADNIGDEEAGVIVDTLTKNRRRAVELLTEQSDTATTLESRLNEASRINTDIQDKDLTGQIQLMNQKFDLVLQVLESLNANISKMNAYTAAKEANQIATEEAQRKLNERFIDNTKSRKPRKFTNEEMNEIIFGKPKS
jgi:hypothetical protein